MSALINTIQINYYKQQCQRAQRTNQVCAYSEVRSVVGQPKCNLIQLFSCIPDDRRAPATGMGPVDFEPTDGHISPVSVRSALFKKAGYPGKVSRRAAHCRAVSPLSDVAPAGTPPLSIALHSRHVRAIPWPSGRRRARRRIDTGHAGRLHSRERARGHVQPRCRGGENARRGKGCRRCHRSGGGPPASRDARRRGCHSAAQRTCARRAGRPTRAMGGRVGLTAARWGASNRAARWLQQTPTRRSNRRRRAGTITRGSSWARRTPQGAAHGRRAQLGAVGGGRGADAVWAL